MNRKKILILGIIAIVCFGITLSPEERKLEGKLDFYTGTMSSDENDKYTLTPPGEENHKRLVGKINADLQTSIREFSSTAFPDFNISLKHQKELLSSIVYDVNGEDAIEDMTDFLLRDAIATRFRLLANEEFLEANQGSEYKGGYSKKMNKTYISHLSGYIGMIAIFCLICHVLANKEKIDPNKFELTADDLKAIAKKSD